MTKIQKDLGVFSPAPTPAHFPENIAFFRNEKGADWYTLLGHNPIKGTITLAIDDEDNRVVLADRDPSKINPNGLRILVIPDEGEPKDMVNKIFKDGKFEERPRPAWLKAEEG